MAKKTNNPTPTAAPKTPPVDETTLDQTTQDTGSEGGEFTGDQQPPAEGEVTGTEGSENTEDGEFTGDQQPPVDLTPAGADSNETASVPTAPAAFTGEKPVDPNVIAPNSEAPVEIIPQTTPTVKTEGGDETAHDAPVVEGDATNPPVDPNFIKSSILVSVWKSNLRNTHGYRGVEELIDLVVNRSDSSYNFQVENADIKFKLDHEIANVATGDVRALQAKVFFSK